MQQWITHIASTSKAININTKEVWEYRDLIALFVKRDFTSKYKQTVLGPMWAVIQPLLTTVVFSIIFGSLAQLTTADVPGTEMEMPSFLFYMIGTVVWSYFSSTVTANANTFIANRAVMGKVYYPRIATPIATALANLISFGIQIVLFVCIALVYFLLGHARIRFSPYLLLLPVLVVQMVMLSTGVGIIISALTTKYRDKTYIFAMNGQSGKFVGDLPMDKGAFWKWFAGLTAAVSAAGVAVSWLLGLL